MSPRSIVAETSTRSSPLPLNSQRVLNNWLAACVATGGVCTLPEHAEEDFKILVREGKEAYYGIRDSMAGTRFHNQVTVTGPSGQRLVFDIYTSNRINI